MKKAAAFRPSSGGSTAKRIFSTDTADIPIRMTGNGCILRPGFMKMDFLILGDKYISHDLVPSFYLADEQTPVCRDIAGSGICKGNSK